MKFFWVFFACLCAAGAVRARPDKLLTRDTRLPQQMRFLERLDRNQGILNLEIRYVGLRGFFGRLPGILRSKPLAKAGMRPFPVKATSALSSLLSNKFRPDGISITRDEDMMVSVFIYVWVNPFWRKRGLADLLLNHALYQTQTQGGSFMLLIHDDDGSGKLVKYYLDRDFVHCDAIVENGLIFRLP